MRNTKKYILLASYITGLIVNIFFTDSVSDSLDFFDGGVWGRMLLFIVPIAFLWLYLWRITEDWWINFFDKHHYRENDVINAPNASNLISSFLVLAALLLTIVISSFLNGRYIEFYVDKDYNEPEISEVAYVVLHRSLFDALYGLNFSTDVYCARLLVSNSPQTFRICCRKEDKLPEDQFKDQLRKSTKVRISNRNRNYFYPICPNNSEIDDDI